MTKKHFQVLADALQAASANEHVCGSVADVCAKFNPLFDRARFLVACGIGQDGAE